MQKNPIICFNAFLTTMLNPTKENTFEKNYEFAKTNYVYNNNYYF